MEQNKIILGIDPGTVITGYGLIYLEEKKVHALDYGCIRPPASLPLTKRYRIIFEGITALLHKFSPIAVSIETQFVKHNPAVSLKLGMARGMALLAASLQEIPIFEYAPSRAKKAVVGVGRASKRQVQKMVKELLSLRQDPTPVDAADALALAICHAHVFLKERHELYQI